MKTKRTDMTKGIVFAGCSFTWGQGLYYYSNMSTLKEPGMFRYDDSLVTNAQRRYMASVRYPRLVSNHFNTFEIVSNHNGGSEDVSFNFLRQVFGGNPPDKQATHLFSEPTARCSPFIHFDEVDYIIFQTSQPNRNPYYYTFQGETHQYRLHLPETYDKFYEYLLENNIDFEDAYTDLVNTTFNRIRENLQFYENQGIKTLLLHWENDYVRPSYEVPSDLPSWVPSRDGNTPDEKLKYHLTRMNDEWMNDRIIKIPYKGKIYTTIRDLMMENREMEISQDYKYFIVPPEDGHPSLDCQRVLADAIIHRIQRDTR